MSMPFGLRNAAHTFQWSIDDFDDLLIVIVDTDVYGTHLRQLFKHSYDSEHLDNCGIVTNPHRAKV